MDVDATSVDGVGVTVTVDVFALFVVVRVTGTWTFVTFVPSVTVPRFGDCVGVTVTPVWDCGDAVILPVGTVSLCVVIVVVDVGLTFSKADIEISELVGDDFPVVGVGFVWTSDDGGLLTETIAVV